MRDWQQGARKKTKIKVMIVFIREINSKLNTIRIFFENYTKRHSQKSVLNVIRSKLVISIPYIHRL